MHGDRDFPSDPRQYAHPYDAPQETDLPPSVGDNLLEGLSPWVGRKIVLGDLPPSVGGNLLKGASIFLKRAFIFALCTIVPTIVGGYYAFMAFGLLCLLSMGAGFLYFDVRSFVTFGAVVGAIVGAAFGLYICVIARYPRDKTKE